MNEDQELDVQQETEHINALRAQMGVPPLEETTETSDIDPNEPVEDVDESEDETGPDTPEDEQNAWETLPEATKRMFLEEQARQLGYSIAPVETYDEPDESDDEDDDVDDYATEIEKRAVEKVTKQFNAVLEPLMVQMLEMQKPAFVARFEQEFGGIMGEHKAAIMEQVQSANPVELAEALKSERRADVEALIYAQIGRAVATNQAPPAPESKAPLAGGSRTDVTGTMKADTPALREHLARTRESLESMGLPWTKEMEQSQRAAFLGN